MTRLTATAGLALAIVSGAAIADEAGPTVTLTDGVVSPQTIEVKSGEATVLTIVNAGATAAEFESKRLRIEQIVAPGKTAKIELRALPAGSYDFVEEFHEDLETARGKIVAK